MIKPIGSRVALKPIEIERKSIGGLMLPDDNSQKIITGQVMSCGVKVTEVKEGDLVLFNKYSGIKLEVEDESISLVEEDEILAIIQ